MDLIYLIDYEKGPRQQVFCAFAEHSTMVPLIHLAIDNQTLEFHPPTPIKEFTKKMTILLDSLVLFRELKLDIISSSSI